MKNVKRSNEEHHHFCRGEMDAQAGHPAYYGCHTGMKSTRAGCVMAYHEGYNYQLAKTLHLNVCAKFHVVTETLSDGSKVWNVTCVNEPDSLVVAFPVDEQKAHDLCAELNKVLRG